MTCTHKPADLKCVTCCAQLLANVPEFPHQKAHQLGILDVIRMQNGAPSRAEVLTELHRIREAEKNAE